jgi:hypothetical protein
MSPYEQGFWAGEHASFKDRKNSIVRCRPERVATDYDRGWWDGYEPRSEAWRVRGVKAATAWWLETERDEA